MIKSITFKSGPKINYHDFEIQISPITIFIGPNNSGKSKILFEIAYYCQSAAKDDNFKIIQDVNFLEYAEEELYVMIQKGYNGIVCVREQNGDYIEKKVYLGTRRMISDRAFYFQITIDNNIVK